MGGIAAGRPFDGVGVPGEIGPDGAGAPFFGPEDILAAESIHGVYVATAGRHGGGDVAALQDVGGLVRSGAGDAVGGDAVAPAVVAGLE